jgi:hypothetical protein
VQVIYEEGFLLFEEIVFLVVKHDDFVNTPAYPSSGKRVNTIPPGEITTTL